MKYTKDKQYDIYAYELGNELVGNLGIESHISVEDFIVDWQNFVKLINTVYGENNSKKPLTVVPDTSFMSDWYASFLVGIVKADPSAIPDIVTHHLYSMGAGVNPNAWQSALNATIMNEVFSLAKNVQAVVKTSSPTSKPWVGEAGGFYNSGSNNVTNAFNSGFWFLDQLGVFAQNGHGAYCRQTLTGGYYSLLDSKTNDPNPDYYSLLTWSRLMGKNVLRVSRGNGAAALSSSNIVRAYAHCMSKDASGYEPGGITMVLINLSNSTAASIDISIGQGSTYKSLSSMQREEYIFSSACTPTADPSDVRTLLACRKVILNGVEVLETKGNEMPALPPMVVNNNSPVVMQPLTYGFISIPAAKSADCM